MAKKLLIVFEGIDGSGKTTQVELLSRYLTEKNISYEVINFPRYEDNLYGQLIKRYLEGEFGSINEVNLYLVALAYAGDRALAKAQIEEWLNKGKVVIANRFVSSSKAYLGANLLEDKREEFFKWLERLEYGENKIPKEDLTILLNVDAKLGQKNVQGGEADIHEDNLKHLEGANKIYLEISKIEENWAVIDCMDNGQMRNPRDINKDIVKILDNVLS